MNFKIELPVNIGDKIYTIEDCKIVEYYVEDVVFESIPKFNSELKYNILVDLERYNNHIDSYKTRKKLVNCFACKKALLSQLLTN